MVQQPAFQVGIRAAILSINGCSSTPVGFKIVKGMPRHVHRKGASRPGNASRTAATSSSVHRIGEMEHFSVLVTSPVASAKRLRIARMHQRSLATGDRRMTRSSAYKDALVRILCFSYSYIHTILLYIWQEQEGNQTTATELESGYRLGVGLGSELSTRPILYI